MGDAGASACVVDGPDGQNFSVDRDRASQVYFVFQCRIGGSLGRLGHHRARHAAIQQGAIPAAMHTACGIGVFELWRAAKNHLAVFNTVQRVVQQSRNWWVAQFAALHSMHEFQP